VQRKLKPLNNGYVMKTSTTLEGRLCHGKCKEDKENPKDVIYAIRCKTCGTAYIGETSQCFKTREGQHRRDIKNGKETNGIYTHLRENENHEINWKGRKFLDHESMTLRRKIKESIFIDILNPQDEMKEIMNLEKGKKISPLWKDLYPSFKQQKQILAFPRHENS
jgi:hypothetical protein